MGIDSLKSRVRSLFRLEPRATGDSWRDSGIPEEQRKLVETELQLMRDGKPPLVYEAAARALKAIPGKEPLALIEVGCASGYYNEVIGFLVGNRFLYHGADYSEAMLDLARRKYPNVSFRSLDIRKIDLQDRAYDVVLSGAVIEHVPEWKQAVLELARITGKYLILHRTPVTQRKSSQQDGKGYTDTPILFNCFNRSELLNILTDAGLELIYETPICTGQTEDSLIITFVFERQTNP